MADVRVASTGDAIPLLDPDGGGVYNVGRNNAGDIRASLLTLIGSPAGSSLTVRPGVYARSFSGGVVGAMRVIQNTVADRYVQVQSGISLHARGGFAPSVAYWPTTTVIQASAANLTNPRIDLVVARVYDKGVYPSDPFHGPYIEIIEGVAAASPVAPAVPDGAIPLGELARDAGVAGDTITTAKITDKRKAASVGGTPRLLLGGDSATDVGYVPGEQRYRVVAGALKPMEYWGADSLWHGTVPILSSTRTIDTTFTTTSITTASVAVADPGWPYRLEADGSLIWTQGIGTRYDLALRLDSTLGTVMGQSYGPLNGTGGLLTDIMRNVSGVSDTTLTGAHVVHMSLVKQAGAVDAGAFAQASAAYNLLKVKVIPV